MHKLHIANTFFEWELETAPICDLHGAFHKHPIFLQLQFLPLLYAESEDFLLLSELAEEETKLRGLRPPTPLLIDSTIPPNLQIESWGHSQLIAKWAKEHGLFYEMPPWQSVVQVHSKEFCFLESPRLKRAELFTDENSVEKWMRSFPGEKVLKSCFGLSGRGHLHLPAQEGRLKTFLQKEFAKKRPIIGEPWVERLLDFSTQWHISKSGAITYIGSTLCFNNSKGQYLMNRVGEEKTLFGEALPYLQEHCQIARPLLEKVAALGFFGNVGCDAMVYREEGAPLLHPLVEINARKTMGWAALAFQRRYFPNQLLSFQFSPGQEGLLHSNLSNITFSRNLTYLL